MQVLLSVIEKRVSCQPRERVIQGRSSDQSPGHLGRTVVAKKIGKPEWGQASGETQGQNYHFNFQSAKLSYILLKDVPFSLKSLK